MIECRIQVQISALAAALTSLDPAAGTHMSTHTASSVLGALRLHQKRPDQSSTLFVRIWSRCIPCNSMQLCRTHTAYTQQNQSVCGDESKAVGHMQAMCVTWIICSAPSERWTPVKLTSLPNSRDLTHCKPDKSMRSLRKTYSSQPR